MTLSMEQFKALRAKGLTTEQIARFEAGEQPTQTPIRSNPMTTLPGQGADMLPGGLGMLGGLIPGPLGYAGAAVGGGGGELLRQLLMQEPMNPKAIGAEAAKSEGAQAVGGVVGKLVLDPLAHVFMRAAVRPTAKLLQDFPTVINDMRRAGVTIGEGGIRRAAKQRTEAALTSEAMRVGAEASGMRNRISDLIPKTNDLVPYGTPNLSEARRQVGKLADQFRRDYRGPLTPTVLKKIKQGAQERALPVLNAVKRNEPTLPGAHMEAQFWDAVAKKADQALSTIPGHKSAELATQRAIGVERAARRGHLADISGSPRWMAGAVGRGLPTAAGTAIGYRKGGVPGAVAGGAAGFAASSPATLSRASVILSNPFFLRLASQLPPHLLAAMLAPPDTTTTPQPNAAKEGTK